MSQENIKLVRDAYAAFNRGDFDAAAALFRPDVEFARPGLETPVRGRDAAREWMKPDAFVEQRLEPLELQARGDKVLVRQRFSARGAGSGIELDNETWAVLTVDADGLIARAEMFRPAQEADALNAAGLRP